MEVSEVNDYIGDIYDTLSEVDCSMSRLPHNPSEKQIDDRIHAVRESMDDITFQYEHDQLDELLEKLYKLK